MSFLQRISWKAVAGPAFNNHKFGLSRDRIGIVIILLSMHAPFNYSSAQNFNHDLKAELDSLVEHTIDHTDSLAPVHGIQLMICSPDKQFEYLVTKGYANWEQREKISGTHPMVLASISKMFTSAVILLLYEEGRINLQSGISHYLGDSLLAQLTKPDDYRSGMEIKVLDLLRHTSGLRDYLFDNPKFLPGVFNEPDKQWSPQSLLRSFYSSGLAQEFPGKSDSKYYYSDTNYLLLGLIIESITGKSLSEVFQEKLFKPLGINDAYLQYYETPSSNINSPVEPYFGSFNISKLNTSFDWAGGGLVMLPQELYEFARALFNNRLFRLPSTLEIYLDGIDTGEEGFEKYNYACGINIVKLADKPLLMGHSGFYGSFLYYLPDSDVFLLGSLNQSEISSREFILKLIDILSKGNLVQK